MISHDGIVTDDVRATITFHLVDPDPEFLYKLTLPLAYPVPPSVPDDDQIYAGIAGTGPYMLEAPSTREGLVLVRNRVFPSLVGVCPARRVSRPHRGEVQDQAQAQVDAVAAGDADVALDAAASDQLEALYVRFAGQVHTSTTPVTDFVVLDTEAPPFDDVAVRRAVNLAVDRGRVVQILGGAALPTCQHLPPNFPGYDPYCPYTLDAGPRACGPPPTSTRPNGSLAVRARSGCVSGSSTPLFWAKQGRLVSGLLRRASRRSRISGQRRGRVLPGVL